MQSYISVVPTDTQFGPIYTRLDIELVKSKIGTEHKSPSPIHEEPVMNVPIYV